MSRFFVAMLGVVLFASVGCSKDKDSSDMHHHSTDAKMMSADACAHCPGIQKANAEGKCPVCGADVSKK